MRGADSCFYCGTAAEIVGLASLDDVPFKIKWEDSLGAAIQKSYKDLVREKIDPDINIIAEPSSVEFLEAEVSDPLTFAQGKLQRKLNKEQKTET